MKSRKQLGGSCYLSWHSILIVVIKIYPRVLNLQSVLTEKYFWPRSSSGMCSYLVHWSQWNNSDPNRLSLNPACGWKPWLLTFPSHALFALAEEEVLERSDIPVLNQRPFLLFCFDGLFFIHYLWITHHLPKVILQLKTKYQKIIWAMHVLTSRVTQ